MKALNSAVTKLRNLDARLLVMLAVLLMMALPELAMASSTDKLPFVDSMTKVANSLTGPFATALSIVAIVGAGAMLIFGGDMNGFMRTLIFLVMVIAMIITASQFVTFLGADGAMLATLGVDPLQHILRPLV